MEQQYDVGIIERVDNGVAYVRVNGIETVQEKGLVLPMGAEAAQKGDKALIFGKQIWAVQKGE